VEDPDKEMSIEEAKKYRDDVKVGDEILIDITPENLEFSRIAVQAAAQTIKQNVKKIERERFFEKFKDKQGQLLKAKVLKVIGDNVILDIDGTTVVLPPEGQVKGKVYNQGEQIIVLLKQIGKGPGGVVLNITQADPDFVKAVLEENVPELEEGKVKIEKIVRIPGLRTKVLVSSEDPRVDPVGVFVGMKGERI
jgi:N utilization substance protein A